MKFYFIRHAPTSANLSGSMVAGYENTDINLYDKPDDWEERVGKFIPEADRKVIVNYPQPKGCELRVFASTEQLVLTQ